MIILPHICLTDFPLVLCLGGQYIIISIVLIGTGIVVGGTVRQGSIKHRLYSGITHYQDKSWVTIKPKVSTFLEAVSKKPEQDHGTGQMKHAQ